MQVPSFRKKLKDCLVCSKKARKNQRFKVGSLTVSLNFLKNQNGLFDVLRMADQSSTYLTITHCMFLAKSVTNPSWLCKLPEYTRPSQNYYVLHGMTCEKICSVFGSNLIKHIFTSMSREGISFCIVPPSCFASVYPLNFLQVYMLGKAIGRGACVVSPYFRNDFNLGLYPTLKRTISLQFEAHGPQVPHQTWKHDMLEIHEFSSHAIVHTTST